MKKSELKRCFGSTPASFSTAIEKALKAGNQPIRHSQVKAALILALIGVMMLAAAAASYFTRGAELFGWFYGQDMQTRLLNGAIDTRQQSIIVGDVRYVLDETTYVENSLYLVGHISPEPGTNVVLMPEDETPQSPAGHNSHLGQAVPKEAKTYAQQAAASDAKLLIVKCAPDSVGTNAGTMAPITNAGYWFTPQPDGSIVFCIEITDGYAIRNAELYTLSIWCSGWEVTPEGQWLRGEPDDTYFGEAWHVTISPRPAG